MINDERFLKRFRVDIDNERFLALKTQNKLKNDVGYSKIINSALNGLKNGKNHIFLGGVGLGKTICALEIAWRLKEADMETRVYYSRYSVVQSAFRANFSNLDKTLGAIFTKDSYYYQDAPTRTGLVIIDEVHNAGDYELLNEIIFSAYDKLVPLILIGNCNSEAFGDMISKMAMSRLLENGQIISSVSSGVDLRQKNDNLRI